MGDRPNTVYKTFLPEDVRPDSPMKPVQLSPGRTHQLVPESRCTDVKPVIRNGVSEFKFEYEDGTVLYVPVSDETSYSFTAGAMRS